MREFFFLLLFLLFNLGFSVYSFTCDPEQGARDAGDCDVIGSTQPTVTLTVDCGWFSDGDFSCSDDIGGNDCLEVKGYDYSYGANGLCYGPDKGEVRDHYCFSSVGECPDGGDSSWVNVDDGCMLFVFGSNSNDDYTRSYRFNELFPARDNGFKIDGVYFDCLDVGRSHAIFDSNFNRINSPWCGVNTPFITAIGRSIYCFNLVCDPDSGWVANSGGINCRDYLTFGDINPDFHCVSGDNDNTCFFGLRCDVNGLDYSSDSLSSYSLIDNNVCRFNPECTSDGWVYESSDDSVLFLSNNSVISDAGSIINDVLSGYERIGDYCVYDASCVDCSDFDCSFNDGLVSAGGGWVAMSSFCPEPGSVRFIGGYKVCFFTDGGGDSCSSSGCSVLSSLMFGDNFECTPTGVRISVPSVLPSSASYQAIPSLLSFGFLGSNSFIPPALSSVASCSCAAQVVSGGVECVNGVYGAPNSTIFNSPDYNPLLPVSSADSITDVNCSCLLPDERLISGVKWRLITSHPIDNDVCYRLGFSGDCYWDYDDNVVLSDFHGSDLLSNDWWCGSVDYGYPCEFVVNKFHSYLFNVSSIIDVVVSFFNPNHIVPVLISSRSSGVSIESSSLPIDFLGSPGSVSVSVDSSPSIFSSASLSFFCKGDPVSVGFNGVSLGLASCDGWVSVPVPISVVNKGVNSIVFSDSLSGKSLLGYSGSPVINPVRVSDADSLVSSNNGLFGSGFFGDLSVGDSVVSIGDRVFFVSDGVLFYSSLVGGVWAPPSSLFSFNGFIASDGSYLFLFNESGVSVFDPSSLELIDSGSSCLPVSVFSSNGLVLFDCGGSVWSARIISGSLFFNSLFSYSGVLVSGDANGDGVTDFISGDELFSVSPLGVVAVNSVNPPSNLVGFGDFAGVNRLVFLSFNGDSLSFSLDDSVVSISGVSDFVFNDSAVLFNSSSGVFLINHFSGVGDLFVRLLLSGDSFSAPSMLVPNDSISVSSVYDSVLDRSVSLGDVLFCDSHSSFSVSISGDDLVNVSVLVGGVPINCLLSNGSPLIDLPAGDYVFDCSLPDCVRGLPLLERLRFCLSSGVGFSDCDALIAPLPIAGDPTGLSVSDISVTDSNGDVITDDSLAICSDISVSVSGLVNDDNSLYDFVSGSRIYAGDSLFSVNNSLTPVSVNTVFNDKLVIPVPDSGPVIYGVSVFTGGYFETSPVKFLTVSHGSSECSSSADCTDTCRGGNAYSPSCGVDSFGCGVCSYTLSQYCSGVAGTCLVYDGCSDGSCITRTAPAETPCFNGDNHYCNGVSSGNAGCVWECISNNDCQEGYYCVLDSNSNYYHKCESSI